MRAEDYFAIQNLVFRYAYHLDRGELAEMATLFAHADVYLSPEHDAICSNPAAIATAFRDFLQLYDGIPRTRHITSNLIIESDGPARATASSYVMVFQQTNSLPLQPIIGGDYHDTFEKMEGTWRFVERRMSNDLFGNLSAHGKFAIGPQEEL